MRALALAGGLTALLLTGAPAPTDAATMKMEKFTLTSPDIKPGSKIGEPFVANVFGCSGGNTSPALSWSGAPDGAKSFMLTVYDPDAPTGSGFWHWVMYNIPASVTSLPQGAGAAGKEPAGAVVASNDTGSPGYTGPCPPKGDKPHRYIFTVAAINTDKLDVPAGATNTVVRFVAHFATIGKASFTAKYGR